MSDANIANQSSAPNSASGHSLARARRQAMSRGGKSGAVQMPKATPAARTVMPAAAQKSAPAQTPVQASAPRPASAQTPISAPASQAPRQDVYKSPPPPAVANAGINKNSTNNDEDCDCTHTAEKQALEAVCALVDADPASPASVRQLCQDRRKALSLNGKTAQKKFSVQQNGMRRNGKRGYAANNLSGRAAAQARREDMCVNGRGDNPACRPSGRVRPTLLPAKVEVGNTLSGNPVTGTQVERKNKMTGVPGSCRIITGTEYIGAEQFGACAVTPLPSPAKVGSGSTTHNQRVSGTQVGRSVQVTGDEHGACTNVTGDEYLNTEQFASFCNTTPAAGPVKVSASGTQRGQRVSGTEVGRSLKVTGDEPGACLKLTGSQYYQPDPSGSVCQGSGVPHKVSVMRTAHERPVTGTDVAANSKITGSEYGACKSVTGTEYAGLEQYQACNRDPVATPQKVSVMRTWRNLPVSGTAVEHNPKVSGDEYGACQPISGTNYIGPDQYAEICATDRITASRERVSTPHGAAGAGMTGVGQEAAYKVTGSARDVTQRVSGSPYSDDAQYAAPASEATRPHPLTRGPAVRNNGGVPNSSAEQQVRETPARVKGNFSVVSPARQAQTSELNRITGTASGTASGRITGPVNLAAGLVSGTPEFRYREDSSTPATAPKAPAPSAAPQSQRVTGEGREAGFTITGADWQRSSSITGTEGNAAILRNPTLRGEPRGIAMPFPALKESEHVPVPPSKVTGSSGNTTSGSTITYSGGARG